MEGVDDPMDLGWITGGFGVDHSGSHPFSQL